ncbi:MAG: response regulator [Leptolyngbyaceae cyanobacterium SM1_3_5]|nr:response regulator [Leptolyngbyaceae cyanobacterium SM1_3_5]
MHCPERPSSFLVLSVKQLPHLFDRFHRVSGTRSRTHEGSGIGLALVQELVQLHSGSIAVSSQLDVGTTFTVSIPLGSAHLPIDRIQADRSLLGSSIGAAPFVEEALRWLPEEGVVDQGSGVSDNSQHPALDTRHPTPRILLADDNADMRDYVQRLLSEFYEVEAVADGEAALQAIDRRIPDLVLTDVMMPRLDGFGLLQALRSRPETQEIPIILLSARAGEGAKVEGLEAGADDYLVKPFAARELLARVRSNLELAQVRQASRQTLQDNEARLQFALDAAGMVAYEWHVATDRVIQSANADRVLGLPAGTTITTRAEFFDLVHPDDRDRLLSEAQAAFAAGSEHRSEFR